MPGLIISKSHEVINAKDFIDEMKSKNVTFYAGVPCSFLTPLINYVINEKSLTYISASNEGDAISIAAGAAIGGIPSVAMMQNSGLGNAISPLTSLTYTFKIPLLIICTHRGAPYLTDEPQHELMGKITSKLFETIGIPAARFPTRSEDINTTIETALANMNESGLPQALIMEKGSVAPCALEDQIVPIAGKNQRFFEESNQANLLTRHEVLKKLVQVTSAEKTVLIATTGYTGRELCAINDRANHLYMVGSMGCASSLALGLALARPDLKVVIIDGDGAALMRMGNLATIGAYSPSNLKHMLLDNEAHDSTGGQQTVSRATDFSKIALACGYQNVWRSDSLKYLDDFIGEKTEKGCHFMHVKIRTGTIKNLPRPAIKPTEVLQRLMSAIALTNNN